MQTCTPRRRRDICPNIQKTALQQMKYLTKRILALRLSDNNWITRGNSGRYDQFGILAGSRQVAKVSVQPRRILSRWRRLTGVTRLLSLLDCFFALFVVLVCVKIFHACIEMSASARRRQRLHIVTTADIELRRVVASPYVRKTSLACSLVLLSTPFSVRE